MKFTPHAAAAVVMLCASCAQTSGPPFATASSLRTGTGNAELQGPSADEVIRQSTHQWHSNRHYDWLDRW